MCCCWFKFARDRDEEMALLCDWSISPLSNRVIAQQVFSLTFTANQELIHRSNFRADILPAHIICTRQEEDLAIFSVSYCIADLNSFKYGSPGCSLSTILVLHHAIRHSFSFAPAPPFAWFLFFYIIRQIQPMEQHNTVLTKPTICVHKLFIVHHCISLRNRMEIVKDRSHINQAQTITPVCFFQIDSTDQNPIQIRSIGFLLDISTSTIYSYIVVVHASFIQISRIRFPARYFQKENSLISILRQIVLMQIVQHR